VLTGFLTIFITLIGYNLLLGHSLTVRTGTLAFVKIGAVLALATSWPAYRTLVYDLVIDGPGQLVAEIGPQAGIVGSDGTLVQRLDLTDQALARLSILGTGAPPAGIEVAPPPFAGFNAFALGGSRILFLLTAIAGIAAVRIVTGLMLALGPFFIAFLMFDSTRSLFEGWIRVLAGAAFATVGVSITLGLELALLDPWLSTVLARRMADQALPTVATELFVISALFAVVVVIALIACARIARAFRLPPILRLFPVMAEPSSTARAAQDFRNRDRTDTAETEQSRAAAVASALVSMNRRELGHVTLATGDASSSRSRTPAMSVTGDGGRSPAPLGRSFSRRPGMRVSARASRRDGET
jgi:type IV secretion system protein VirB6